MMITGEYKVKKQKNGNAHNYTYYHCTKKSKTIKCPEPCIREEELNRQLSSLIKSVSLPQDWAEELNRLAVQDHKKSAQSNSAFVEEWIKDAQNLNGIARDNDLFAKKVVAKEIFDSNLFLGEKTVRPAEGRTPNSFGKMGGNQWDALRASHLLALKKPLSSVLVRRVGFEPKKTE